MFREMVQRLETTSEKDVILRSKRKLELQDELKLWQEMCANVGNYYYDKSKANGQPLKNKIDEHLKKVMSLNLENKIDCQTFVDEVKNINEAIKINVVPVLKKSSEQSALDEALKNVMKIPAAKGEFKMKEKESVESGTSYPSEKVLKDVLPIAEKLIKGCDLHILPSLPDVLFSYQNSYVLAKDKLFYVSYCDPDEDVRFYKKIKISYEDVKIMDFPKLLADLKELNPENKKKILLTKEQYASLIISNGGHDKARLSESSEKTIDNLVAAGENSKKVSQMLRYDKVAERVTNAGLAYNAVFLRYSISELRAMKASESLNFIDEIGKFLDVKREQYLMQAKQAVSQEQTARSEEAVAIQRKIASIEKKLQTLMNDVLDREAVGDFKNHKKNYKKQLKEIEKEYYLIKGEGLTKGLLETAYPKIHETIRISAKSIAADKKNEKSKSSTSSEIKSISDKSEHLQGQAERYSSSLPNRRSSTIVTSNQTKRTSLVSPKSAWDEVASPSGRSSIVDMRQRSATLSSTGSAGILRRVSSDIFQELQHLQGDGRTAGKEEKFPQIDLPGLGGGRLKRLSVIQQAREEVKVQDSPSSGKLQETPGQVRDEETLFQKSPKSR
jgi:hypothetical protein